MTMPVEIVVAMGRNRVIGRDGDMPWRLPTDLRHFKARTLGNPIIMGRKTFESIGRALPGRTNIVITRNPDFAAPPVLVAGSPGRALDRAAAERDANAISVIGGGRIYEQMIEMADRLVVTHVLASPEGDVEFPAIDPTVWCETERSEPIQAEGDSHAIEFAIYERR